MPMVPFCGGSYQDKAPGNSSELTLNMYPEVTDGGNGKTNVKLINIPGTSEFVEISIDTGDFCRGLYATTTGKVYCVFGNTVYEVLNNGTKTTVGTISNTAVPIKFSDDGINVIFADGSTLYSILLADNTLSPISSNTVNPTDVVWLDGRFYAINGKENLFYWSALGDGLTWTGTDTGAATAESSADVIRALAVVNGNLWLLGAASYEIWRTNTDPDFPVSRIGASPADVGVQAVYSVATIGDSLFFIGSSKAGKNIVFQAQGQSAKRISNHAIEEQLNKASTTTDAVGWTYQENGHVFYVVNFLTFNRTFVYDVTSGMWHNRATNNPQTGVESYYPVQYAVFAFDQILVCGLREAKVLTLDSNVYTEYDGRYIIKERTGPIYWDDLKRIHMSMFQLDIEAGQGVQTGQGSDPKIMLQISRDGGYTWSNEIFTGLGKIGQYRWMAKWRRLGMTREAAFRVRYSEPTKFIILGAKLVVK